MGRSIAAVVGEGLELLAKRVMKLKRHQRAAIFAGEKIRISGKGDCPVKTGDEIRLSPRVAIRVRLIRRNRRNNWSLDYTIVDDRDLYLLPSSRTIGLTEDGEARAMSEADALGYTTSRARALDAGEALDATYAKTVDRRRRLKAAMNQQERAEEFAKRDVRVLAAQMKQATDQMVKAGADPQPMLAALQRELQNHQREVA
jgi:hypothetical protein